MQRFPMTAGRWAALAVGTPLALALIGWTGLNAVAAIGQGSFPVSASIPVHDGVLRAAVDGGDMIVRPAAGASGQLTGTMHYSLIKPHLRYTSSGVNVSCPLPLGNCSLDGTLGVPAGAAVDLSTGGGNVTVSGLATSVVLNSGGGDLTAEKLSGDLTMGSGGGNIAGEDLTDQHVTVHTGGGDVTLTFARPPASLQVGTGGGNITLNLPHNVDGYRLLTHTGGGNTNIGPSVHQNSDSPDVITLTTGGGDITVTEASS